MKKGKVEGMNMFLRVLLMSSGADIVAPKEVKDSKLEVLGLTGEEGFEYEAVAKILNNIVPYKRVNVLKAAIATTLTPSEMMEVIDDTRESVKSILEYTKDHPESREEINPSSALKKMLGSDFDIDKE
jgi:hypothetical protein